MRTGDTEEDQGAGMKPKTIRVDIDGTICKTEGLDYASAVPIPGRIAVVNSWYDAGHTIIYWTARGALTGTDWTPLTRQQLNEWGCRYHALDMDKPLFDEFYDDRAFNAEHVDFLAAIPTGAVFVDTQRITKIQNHHGWKDETRV